MARTYKDRPPRVRYPHEWKWDISQEIIEYENEEGKTRFTYLKKPGANPKRKRNVDTEWHWMSTPSWWTRLTMNRPQRVCSKQWERMVVRGSIESLEECDPPPLGKKPHIYYW